VLYPEAARAEDREQLRSGTYQPQPVRRVEIRKPDGQGMRKLGIPSGLDRFVQPACCRFCRIWECISAGVTGTCDAQPWLLASSLPLREG
jgi:hypothetical protein